MEKTELYNFENTEVTAIDFDGMKAYLENALKAYSSCVYTVNDIAAAKNNKSELNKIKKIIEDKRKEYKAKCLAPYEAVEYRFKELVSMIDKQRRYIDDSIADLYNNNAADCEAELKKIYGKKFVASAQYASRETELKKYYDGKSAAFGQYADRMYKRIFDDCWLRDTYSMKQCEEEILVRISEAVCDINNIKKLRSPFLTEIIDLYLSGASYEACIAANEKLTNAVEKIDASVSGASSKAVVAQEIEDKADSKEGITVRIKGSKFSLEQVFDFMKIMGIDFEII